MHGNDIQTLNFFKFILFIDADSLFVFFLTQFALTGFFILCVIFDLLIVFYYFHKYVHNKQQIQINIDLFLHNCNNYVVKQPNKKMASAPVRVGFANVGNSCFLYNVKKIKVGILFNKFKM